MLRETRGGPPLPAAERPAREARRAAALEAAAAQTGGLAGRELLIAGAIAYRCEGAGTVRRRTFS